MNGDIQQAILFHKSFKGMTNKIRVTLNHNSLRFLAKIQSTSTTFSFQLFISHSSNSHYYFWSCAQCAAERPTHSIPLPFPPHQPPFLSPLVALQHIQINFFPHSALFFAQVHPATSPAAPFFWLATNS